MKLKLQSLLAFLFFVPALTFAWHWQDLWFTPDQQAATLLKQGDAKAAANQFQDKNWQAAALYRAQNYAEALTRFREQPTSDGQYNAGNALAHLGRYKDAIAAYDKAIALNANNQDAIYNREIIKKLMQEKQQQNQSNNKNADAKNKKEQSQKQNANNQSSAQQNKNEHNAAQNKPEQNPQEQTNNNQNTQRNNANNQDDSKQNADPRNNPNSLSEQDTHAKQQAVRGADEQAESKANQQSPSPQEARAQEEKQQLLRRVAEDPGGLLRQKFLRDYLRRHRGNLSQGTN